VVHPSARTNPTHTLSSNGPSTDGGVRSDTATQIELAEVVADNALSFFLSDPLQNCSTVVGRSSSPFWWCSELLL
jgi:hypothetical protein